MSVSSGNPHPHRHPLRRALRWTIYGLSLLLLAACVAVALHDLRWSTLAHISYWPFVGLVAIIGFSLILNAFLFQMATHPFEQPGLPISIMDWQAMMTATALVNYLPKAGLVGRTALLKYRWHIKYRATLFTLAIISTMTVLIMAFVLGLTIFRHGVDAFWIGAVLVALPLTALVGIPLVTIGYHRFHGHLHQRTLGLWLLLWLSLRFLDTLTYIGRLYLAARVIGISLSFEETTILAITAMFITMASPIPNGIGIRTLLYGILASYGLGGHPLHSMTPGVRIGVVDRLAEAIAFVSMGAFGIVYLHRRGLSLTAHTDPDAPIESLENEPEQSRTV